MLGAPIRKTTDHRGDRNSTAGKGGEGREKETTGRVCEVFKRPKKRE